ncbi:unnamed protein product [Darwinula stevensoni]|uniref:Chitin-binding type-2 domain-containing protein n=1 Tax=Darwinula stevensoni TaxID=69355 RepID=A0A7R9A0M3_9CRUS|nr:unnamed protein product [Darwinula stevensoni]CAG0881498.1 unnamed protein product [Darwinula stevensoni]
MKLPGDARETDLHRDQWKVRPDWQSSTSSSPSSYSLPVGLFSLSSLPLYYPDVNMRRLIGATFLLFCCTPGWTSILNRVKRQDQGADATDFEKELCKNRLPGEWFRLVAATGDECRNVIQCTSSGLQAIRCPPGLYFDIEAQTCNWKDLVGNCNKKEQVKKAKPLLSTEEPICQDEYLACADSTCIPRKQFCDGTENCADGSDEASCDINNDPNRAPVCNTEICQIPECFCSPDGTAVPGNLEPKRIPQMVTVTFDDAINVANIDLYNEIFNGKRKNPNGCNIKATFFVSHKYSNYSAVQDMFNRGHEIASHSITHTDNETFWSHASIDDWAREMAGSRIIIEKFANITDNSVVGLRAPYLRVGGNNQFTMMEEQAFLYDSTVTAPLSNPPLWPYTLYFRMPHQCYGNLQNCPTRSHAVWEMVMNELDMREDPKFDESLPGCAMVDSCSNILNGDQFYNFLNYNFDRHYLTNRAPFGLYFHAAWLQNNLEYLDAFLYWMDEVSSNHEDVYFVTMTQAIQWIQNPRTTEEVRNFEPWKARCNAEPSGTVCGTPNACPLTTKELPGETLRLHTCMKCPQNYPWLLDPLGEGRFV